MLTKDDSDRRVDGDPFSTLSHENLTEFALIDRLLAESFDLPEGALTDLLDPKERSSLSVHDLTKLLLNAP